MKFVTNLQISTHDVSPITSAPILYLYIYVFVWFNVCLFCNVWSGIKISSLLVCQSTFSYFWNQICLNQMEWLSAWITQISVPNCYILS